MENKTKGSGLIFAVVLLFVILGMVITLSSVTVLETKMSQKTKSSVGAFYNSESGVEWALNKVSSGSGTIATVFSGIDATTGKKACPDFGSGSPCNVYFLDSAGKVINSSNSTTTTASDISLIKAVRSVGSQGGETQRAIEAAVAAIDVGKFQIYCWPIATSPTRFDACIKIDTTNGTSVCRMARCDSDGDPCLGGDLDGTIRPGNEWRPCPQNPF